MNPLARFRSIDGEGGLFFKDTAWRLADELAIVVAGVISFPLLGRTLGTAGYGAYIGLYGIIGPLSAISFSGAMLAALRAVVRDHQDGAEVTKIYLSFTALGALVLTPIGWAIALSVLSDISGLAIALLLFAELFVVGIIAVQSHVVQGVIGYGPSTMMRMAVPATKVIVLIALTFADAMTVENIAIYSALAFLALGWWMMFVYMRRYGLVPRYRTPTKSVLKDCADFSLPTFASSLMAGSDKVILNGFDDQDSAGVLGAAQRAVQMASLPLRSLNGAAFQRFLKHDENKPGQHLQRSIAFTKLFLAFSLLVSIGLWVFAPQVLWIVGDEFEETVTVIRWLAPVVLIRAVSQPPINGLIGAGKPTLRAWILMSTSAITLLAFMVLIAEYSWRGAVYANVVGSVYLGVTGWAALIVVERRSIREARLADAAAGRYADSDVN